jgi:hypothetical protein
MLHHKIGWPQLTNILYRKENFYSN